MKKPEGYSGPEIEVVIKDTKADNLSQVIDDLLKKNVKGKKIAMFQKNEEEDGDLTKTLIQRVKHNEFELSEMKIFMDQVNKVKIEEELVNIKVAANFTEWSFKKLISDLENCIDTDAAVKHRKISQNIEKLLYDQSKLQSFMNKAGVTDGQLLEYPIPVLVQSGDNFTLNKFSTECDDNKLTADVLYLNICSNYTDMHAMASRTLLINPT